MLKQSAVGSLQHLRNAYDLAFQGIRDDHLDDIRLGRADHRIQDTNNSLRVSHCDRMLKCSTILSRIFVRIQIPHELSMKNLFAYKHIKFGIKALVYSTWTPLH